MNDCDLLKQYARNGSEAAFAQLVDRHMKGVYTTCLRDLGDSDLAHDAAQVTFLVLAKKARTLGLPRHLGGWLFITARLTCKNVIKQEIRRKTREANAVKGILDTQARQNTTWSDLEPIVNDALTNLRADDREVIVLRFFNDWSTAAMAASLGLKEDAVRQRLSRAIDRLRVQITRRGLTVGAIALTALLGKCGERASALSLPTWAPGQVTAAGHIGSLATTVTKHMFVATAKSFALAGCGVALVVAGVTPMLKHPARAAVPPASYVPAPASIPPIVSVAEAQNGLPFTLHVPKTVPAGWILSGVRVSVPRVGPAPPAPAKSPAAIRRGYGVMVELPMNGGVPTTVYMVRAFQKGPAAEAGLPSDHFSKLIAIDGAPINNSVMSQLRTAPPPLRLTIAGADGATRNVTINHRGAYSAVEKPVQIHLEKEAALIYVKGNQSFAIVERRIPEHLLQMTYAANPDPPTTKRIGTQTVTLYGRRLHPNAGFVKYGLQFDITSFSGVLTESEIELLVAEL